MSFGKRQIVQNTSSRRASSVAAGETATNPAIVAVVSIVVGIMGMATIYGVATKLRPTPVSRTPVDVERSEGAAAHPSTPGKQAPIANLAKKNELGRSATPAQQKVIAKEQIRNDNGRVGQEIVQFSDGTSETRDFTYSESGKLERMTARNSDGRMSVTVYTGRPQTQDPIR